MQYAQGLEEMRGLELVLVHANIVDLVHESAQLTENATITVRDGRIAAIDTSGSAPKSGAEREVHDLAGRFVMPGLWDAHAHLGVALPQSDPSKLPPIDPPPDRTIRAGRNAIAALRGGITAVRVVGEAYGVDFAWKRAFDSGSWVGPRLFVCGPALACTGGHGTVTGLSIGCDGPDGFRRAVREQVTRGADQIKLVVTGGLGGRKGESAHEVELTVDEMGAAIEVAHARGRIVGGHIGAAAGAKAAVEAGIDCVEHGYFLDEEVIALMVLKGTYYVPTLTVTQLPPERYEAAGHAAFFVENIARSAELHRRSFKMALDAGVRIASGEDLETILPYAHDEIELLIRNGMTPYQALVAATRTPATICGVEDRLGTVEQGKIADLVVLPHDPLEDITAIRTPLVVLKDGRLVAGEWP